MMLEEKVSIVKDAGETLAGTKECCEPPPPVGVAGWCRKKAYDTFVAPLVVSRHPPWYDARGVSLGLIVGIGVPVGTQIVTLGLLRTVSRFNFLVAVAFSFVCNPLNMIPLYYGYYRLGAFIMGHGAGMDFAVFNKMMNPVTDSTYFWEAATAFAHLGTEILLAWCIAAVLLSVVFGTLGYLVTLKIQHVRCARRAAKMGIEYEKFLQQQEDQLCADECARVAGHKRST
jgi:uncharacterized protein (DUF2062 family)